MIRRNGVVLVTVVLIGCTPQAPKVGVEIKPVPVNNSFTKTWDAVIDYFATASVPVKTLERASGIIITEDMRVGLADALKWGDCGADPMGTPYPVRSAAYNVRVQGDSAQSTVRVTAVWRSPGGMFDCTTKGVYELDLMRRIKARAEGQ